MRHLFRLFSTSQKHSQATLQPGQSILLYQNPDRLLVRVSYFALVAQTLFWASTAELAFSSKKPLQSQESSNKSQESSNTSQLNTIHEWLGLSPGQTIGLCTGLASLFPMALWFGAKRRIKKLSLLKNTRGQLVVKSENFLPFRNTEYYEASGMYCHRPAPQGTLLLKSILNLFL